MDSMSMTRLGMMAAAGIVALAAGAALIVPIFSFPGGRRFHVRDPAGNEIAVTQPDSEHQE